MIKGYREDRCDDSNLHIETDPPEHVRCGAAVIVAALNGLTK